MTIQSQFPASRPSLLLDFANAKRLDPRVTFTRASTARFYDGSTVAKAEENLLTQSQAFNESAWTKANTTATADQTTAPDGTLTADLIAEAAVTDTHQVFRASNVAITSGLTYTFSIFLKKGTGATAPNIVQLTFVGGQFGTGQYANFNLDTGAVGTNTGVTASIVNAGSGWYRCIITRAATASSTTSAGAIIAFTNNNDGLGRVPSYAGATTSDVFAWGAQLEERSSVTAYTPTTTAPITNYIPVLQTAASGQARFDHNPVTGESLGLLIEESRTNLFLYSGDLSDAAFVKSSVTVSSNTIVAPDGTLTGDKVIVDSGTASASGVIRQQITKAASAITYTASFFAKAGEFNSVRVIFRDVSNSANFVQTYFNLATGTVASAANSGGTFSAPSSSISAVGNGWYRCVLTGTTGTETAVDLRVFEYNNGTNSITGDGYAGLYLWGYQLEAGAFPTSYIQTVAASATRQADAASMTGANFTSWFDATEGAMYADATFQDTNSAVVQAIFEIGDNTANNRIRVVRNVSTSAQRYLVTSAGSQVVELISSGAMAATGTRAVATYKVNDFASTFNSGTVLTDTSGAVPAGMSQMTIGQLYTATNYLNGTLRKLAYYPLRLTDAQLQTLTR